MSEFNYRKARHHLGAAEAYAAKAPWLTRDQYADLAASAERIQRTLADRPIAGRGRKAGVAS